MENSLASEESSIGQTTILPYHGVYILIRIELCKGPNLVFLKMRNPLAGMDFHKIHHQGFSILIGIDPRFRCQKYWLQGEKKGKTEIFVENLPGGPDNINLAPDGTFWIALLQLIAEGREFVHYSKPLKHIVASFPKLMKQLISVYKKASVVNVGGDGRIIRKFDDPDGKVLTFVTSALEYEDHLFLGSLNTNFVGKLPLKTFP